jgi:hypothetical protein
MLVQPVVSGSTITTTVENNTDLSLTFHTAVQVLTQLGADVIPAIVGPDLTVASGATSSPWVMTIPPLPDGFHRVPVTATTTDPVTGTPLLTSFAVYFSVTGGTLTEIDFGTYYEATGHELVEPFIE